MLCVDFYDKKLRAIRKTHKTMNTSNYLGKTLQLEREKPSKECLLYISDMNSNSGVTMARKKGL